MNPSSDETLFAEALARPAADRAAFLDQACAADAAQRARVESLLKVHADAQNFLQSAAPVVAETVAQSVPRREEKAGDRIGRYKLLQQIGEGGCGVVYMAEQEVPVHRRVALKVIKLGMDTKEVIARFEAERQALAMMDHPNIAKVLDAGATDTGRPFFVMELVRGLPITKHCDENSLSTEARLDLFTQVCHAIQHAHQKGVIHRDIKPSNILVTLHDGVPVPKVIDFGIAKATQGRLTDATLFTAFEQFIGTPAYMSPEQAELSGLDVDTRADIYSLGVLLYEMLTGRTPFDSKTFLAAGLDEMRRIIREVEPPKPSTRLSTLTDADRSTVARLRGTVSTQLFTLLRGDLDWIVMKALEKNRTRRYESADALAADIRRHLHNEPVIARPPSTAYLLQKLVHRHKLTVAAGSAIAAALVLGLGFSTWALIQEKAAREYAVAAEQEQIRLRKQAEAARAEEAKQRGRAEEARANEAKQRLAAEANEKKAKSEAAKSEQAFKFMAGMLQGVGPSVAAGRDTTLLREILDKTLRRLDKTLQDQPEVDANLRGMLGGVYLDLGDVAKAEAMIVDALARTEKIHGRDHPTMAGALSALGMVRLTQGRNSEGEVLARESLAILQKHPVEQDKGEQKEALFVLSIAQAKQGMLVEAEAGLRRILELARRDPDAENSGADSILMLLGNVLVSEGRLAEAEPMIREALAAQRQQHGNEHPTVGYALITLARVLWSQDKLAESAAAFNEGLAILRKTYGPDHPNIARLLLDQARIVLQQRKLPEAEALLREALVVQRKVLGPEHENVAATLQLLAQVLQQEGKVAEIEALQREATAIQKKTAGSPELAEAQATMNRAVTALQQGKWAEAERGARDAITTFEKHTGPGSPQTITSRQMLADAVFRQGRSSDAETIVREVLGASRQAFGNNSTRVADALLQLAWALEAQGKLVETESCLREVLAISKTFTTDGANAQVADAMLLLATIRARLGDPADASVLATDAAEMARKLPDKQRDSQFSFADSMATTLRTQGKPAEAERVERVLLDYARRRDGPESRNVAIVLVRLAQSLNGSGKFAEAEKLAHQGWLLRQKLQPATDWTVANAQGVLGQSLLGLKRYAEAETMLLAAFRDMQANANDATKATGGWRSRQRDTAGSLMRIYEVTNQPAKAAEWREKATAFTGFAAAAKATAKPGGPDLAALTAQDNALKQQGKFVEAEVIERQMLELAIASGGPGSTLAANHCIKLAQTLNQIGKFAEAEPLARESLALREKLLAPTHWNIPSTRSALGASLLGQRKFADAEPILLRAYADLLRVEATIPAIYRSRVPETAMLLAELYEKTGQPDKAAEWKNKAAASGGSTAGAK